MHASPLQAKHMNIRLLNETDAAGFQTVRLRFLREHPEAFGASWEEERRRSTEDVAAQLRDNLPNIFTFGAFVENNLIGIVSLQHFVRPKVRHRAIVGGMYVVLEARGQGVGEALLDAVIKQARSLDSVQDVSLVVTVGNSSARTLYIAAGFVAWASSRATSMWMVNFLMLNG